MSGRRAAGTLEDLIKDGYFEDVGGDGTKVNLDRTSLALTQVTLALRWLYKANHTHSDVKPAKFVVTWIKRKESDGSERADVLLLKILDLGHACWLSGGARREIVDGRSRPVVSVYGGGGGTRFFAAPEQLNHATALSGEPQDSYAVCALMLEIVSGHGATQRARVGVVGECAPLAFTFAL